jgi:hypothetical protein
MDSLLTYLDTRGVDLLKLPATPSIDGWFKARIVWQHWHHGLLALIRAAQGTVTTLKRVFAIGFTARRGRRHLETIAKRHGGAKVSHAKLERQCSQQHATQSWNVNARTLHFKILPSD